MNGDMMRIHAMVTDLVARTVAAHGCTEREAFGHAFRRLNEMAPRTAAAYSRWLAANAK